MARLAGLATSILVAFVASGCATGIVTGPPSDLTETSATVNGIVWTTDGGGVTYWVDYGTTIAYGRQTARRTAEVAEDTPHDVSIPLDGLTPSTTWHYRICAEDAQAATCSQDALLFTGDSVTGSARDCMGSDLAQCARLELWWSLSLDARSGPTGGGPVGYLTFSERLTGRPGLLLYETHATCLAVSGRTAVVGVEGTADVTGLGIRTWVAGHVRVTDGGGADSGRDTFEVDVTLGPFPPGPPTPPEPGPTDCSTFQAGEVFRNDEGDLAVSDAAAR